LQSDAQERESALRLKGSANISPATMQDPVFVYPGQWHVTVDNFGQGTTTNLINLGENGGLTGRVLEFGGAAMNVMGGVLAADPALQAFVSSMMQNMAIAGRWAYDKTRLLLSLGVTMSVPGMPMGGQSDTWQIELLGCN